MNPKRPCRILPIGYRVLRLRGGHRRRRRGLRRRLANHESNRRSWASGQGMVWTWTL